MNKTVDNYLLEGCGRCALGGTSACKVHTWTAELSALRSLVVQCGLTEECKWGIPCYTYQGKNVLLVSAFKDYCSISFLKGSLLSNSSGLLIKPGKHSQAARLIKIKHLEEVKKHEADIKSCIYQAVEVEKAGLQVPFKKNPEPLPEELKIKFKEDASLKTAFDMLTPGRQRGYIIYFSQPKQAKTRVTRIEKSIPKILNGEGLHDKYSKKK